MLAYRTNKKQPKASVISKKIDDFPSGVILIVFIARTLQKWVDATVIPFPIQMDLWYECIEMV
jgi:hypothetical protein